MSREEFESLVNRLELLANRNPGLYKLRVVLVALLGYTFIFSLMAIPILLIALASHLILNVKDGLQMGIPLVILVFLSIRSFWVKLGPPAGFPLKKADDSNLQNFIKGISKKLNTPKVDHIILTDQLNTAFYRYPRFSFFGFHKNFLILGLPMLIALSKEELESIIAHQMGHFSQKHNWFNKRIYSLKNIFIKLLRRLHGEKERSILLLLKKFIDWYVPILDAYTFTLIRKHEYKTDKLAAEVTDPETLATALIKSNIAAIYFDRIFWNKIFAKTKKEPKPVNYIYFRMINDIKEDLDEKKIDKMLKQVLNTGTHSFDPHPVLSDRLKALEANQCQIDFQEDAMTTLFQNKEFYLNKLSQVWEKSVEEWWKKQYKEIEEKQKELEKLEAKEDNNLSIEERFKRATLIEEIRGTDEGLKEYQDIIQDNEFAPAIFSVGRILTHREDKQGIELIEKAMKLDHRCTVEGCRLIHNYLASQGEMEKAKQYYHKAENYKRVIESAREERKAIKLSDNYCEHQLSKKTVEEVKIKLEQHNDIQNSIKEVYLVRKDVKYLQEYPLYVIGIKFKDIDSETQSKLVNQIAQKELGLVGDLYVVPLHDKNKQLEETMEKIDDAKIISES